ncbi:MAG: 50S ribosomal protein L30 [Tannerellaceae bacterium]|nr:50S ribosomal protein L30 [Tannerellaceae bacterium]
MTIIKIKRVGSLVRCPQEQKRTLGALGLRKINRVVEHEVTPTNFGMVKNVRDLVSIVSVII